MMDENELIQYYIVNNDLIKIYNINTCKHIIHFCKHI